MADPVATNPELYSVVFENARVRVLRYHDRPGDHTQPHYHPDSVMITMSSFERRLVHGDQSVEVTLPAGEVRWLGAQEHSGHNIGSTDTMTLFVELKKPTPAWPDWSRSPAARSGRSLRALISVDRFPERVSGRRTSAASRVGAGEGGIGEGRRDAALGSLVLRLWAGWTFDVAGSARGLCWPPPARDLGGVALDRGRAWT